MNASYTVGRTALTPLSTNNDLIDFSLVYRNTHSSRSVHALSSTEPEGRGRMWSAITCSTTELGRYKNALLTREMNAPNLC